VVKSLIQEEKKETDVIDKNGSQTDHFLNSCQDNIFGGQNKVLDQNVVQILLIMPVSKMRWRIMNHYGKRHFIQDLDSD